ncbi:Mu-like prophage major head subunit gpT family protein [Terrimonas sp. NA20]|uniref:Mu-like prophage major head subunit gpT family protein n=1 Tax=Terrimonas ginsenosidimutans TaxID=2908004 RepID=A0ABS9KRE6_9BACT|nr:Mu-like prophage major head subunit gpT family protein [Terrimonas ginsenosidimutans]
MNTKKQLPKQIFRAKIDTTKIDNENKTFPVVFATETPVFRRHWEENFNEILSCKKEHMRTERMDNGVCPLLDNHDMYSGVIRQYGKLLSYEIVDGEVRGLIQFSSREEFKGVWDDIVSGIISGISVRYIVHTYQREITENKEVPNYRAIDWEPTEISLTPVPADYNSSIRSEQQETFEVQIRNLSNKNSETNMKPTVEGVQPDQTRTEGGATPAAPIVQTVNEEAIRAQAAQAERQRSSDIRQAVRAVELEESVADELINSGVTIDQARASIFEKVAAKKTSIKPQGNAANASASGDERTGIRAAMQEAIIFRAEPGSVKLSEKAQDFRGMKMFDIARHFLQEKGENPLRYSQNETVKRAISTTDLPDLLTDTTSRQLRKFFDAQNSSWEFLGTRTTVSDFREKTGVQIDGAVTFDKIAESGEYKSAKILQNTKAKISVDTYGKIVKITRQAIINDDLDAFARIPKIIAQGARNLQASMFWNLITGNVATPDGTALFHADHGNLAGAGATISEATLNAAIVAMMKQQSPAKEELGLTPKYLVVPVELQTTAKKLMASITATKTGDVNPFNNAFEVISEVRLSRNSPIAWYMFADPATVEGAMYCYLDGEEGLRNEGRVNFDDDSVETKSSLEFGVANWDYRGAYKNPGA